MSPTSQKPLLALVLAVMATSCLAPRGLADQQGGLEGQTPAARPDRPIGTEYKYRLSGLDGLGMKQARKRIADLLSPLILAGVSGWDRKKCRLVQFHDTRDRSLRDAGLILRVRKKMDEKRCADATGMTSWDVVWKWRGSDASIAEAGYDEASRTKTREDARAAADKITVKLEQDVAFSSDQERRVTSTSAKIQPRFAAAKRQLPTPLPTLGMESVREALAGKPLAPLCGLEIAQSRWQLETLDRGPLSSLELTHWTRPGAASAILELSFRSDGDTLASELATKLRLQLANHGLLPSGAPVTKTAWAEASCERD